MNSDKQLFVTAALALYNIDVHILHVKLKFNECQKMIHEFIIKSKNVMILICSFYINFSEFNLQSLCHNVHLWNISMSEVLLMQAIEHVRHLGQKHIVKIYNYMILNSFNIKQLKNNLIKMIFNLIHQQIVIKSQAGPGLPELWDWLSWWSSCILLWVSLLLVLVLNSFNISCWLRASPGLF